jgi:hypothetical protein
MATTWKDPVKVATTENLGSPPKIPLDGKIDGVTLAAGDRVLVKDQDNLHRSENGIYEVQSNPNPGSPALLLARPNAETVEPEDVVRVSEGKTNPHTEWSLRAQGTIVIDTTDLPWIRRDPFFNVLDFGADPSGKADSYQAFQDWAHAITVKGGGVGLVPPGTYKIDQILDWDGGNIYNSDIRNFVFDQCNGLHLVGFGATINLKGYKILKTREHHLTLDNGTILYYSFLRMVGFVIQNCDNVCIEGFDINGNANLVEQDSDDDHPFAEGGDDILSICGSRNVSIRNMRIHHAWTDGISVRRSYPVAPSTIGIGCQQVVIENCEVYANARCNISGHEFRHMRITDCRLHHGGLTGGVLTYSPACNIDIEPDPVKTDLSPADWSAETGTPSGLRFVILENCEFVDSKGVNVVINVRFSHFVVRGCFFNNSSNSSFPCIFSVPHCSIQDSEIDTSTGRIDVALTGTQPGGNVFTMERCLIRASSGQGLAIIPQQGFIAQALIANCRFICEATIPTDNGFPVVETGRDMLMLTFRDNYTFIPAASYSKEEPQTTIGFKVCSTVAASLAENNVWETDFVGDETHYLGVYYHTDSSVYPKYPILVRNERFLAWYDLLFMSVDLEDLWPIGRNLVVVALVGPVLHPELQKLHIRIFDGSGKKVVDKAENQLVSGATLTALKNQLTLIPDASVLSKEEKQKVIIDATSIAGHTPPDGKGIRPFDASDHDNTYPYSQGVDALGGELQGDILKLGEQRMLFAVTEPLSGVFRQGDLIFNTRPQTGLPMGWVCTKEGTAGALVDPAMFAPMPNL